MRRAVARGRVFPQSYSTDRRYGRLSLKACALFPLMWANADDQGRLCGEPEEVKYACCPNIDHITKADIPGILRELRDNSLIKLYETPKSTAIQILDWWDIQKPQWAWPSDYPPPDGWQDRLRYKKDAKTVISQNWPSSGERQNGAQVSEKTVSGEDADRAHLGANNGSPETPKHAQVNSVVSETTPEKVLAGASPSPGEFSGKRFSSLAEEIRSAVIGLPHSESRILDHERIKEELADLGTRKGYIPQEEAEVDQGRIDLCWQTQTGEIVAAFEIETLNPKGKSLAKLANLKCAQKFIILRTNALPFEKAGDMTLIGLNWRRRKPLPLEPKERQGSEEREVTEKETETERGIRNTEYGIRNSPEHSGEYQKGTQVSTTQVAKKPPDPFAEERKTVFEGLKERRGYNSPRAGAEAQAITWMLKQGYSVEHILSAYDTLKRDEFWRNKLLSMQSVKSQVGELVKGSPGKLPSGEELKQKWT